MLVRLGIIILVLAMLPATSMAICSAGHPTVEQEVGSAEGIIVGKVVREKPLQEDQEDPMGVTAYVYSIDVIKTVRGDVSGAIIIRNDNTSSRFPLVLGAQYLLFLHKDSGGDFWVNSCGNSGPLPKRKGLLSRLLKAQVAK